MFEPKYTISDRLLSAIVKTETTRTAMELSTASGQIKAQMTDLAKAQNLLHLAHMLELTVTLKDAQKLADGYKLEFEDVRGDILANFRNVLEFNRSNVADSYMDLDFGVMLHLNKILLTRWQEPWEVKFRLAGEKPDASYDSLLPLVPELSEGPQLQEELRELLDWYRTSNARINDLIRIGVLVYRLIELLPFRVANELTIMALVDFLLYRYGYVAKTNLPVMMCFDTNHAEQLDAWQLSKRNYDLTLWLERFVRDIAKCMQEAKTEMDNKVNEEHEKTTKQPFLDLNNRQLKVLRYLQTIPTVKREDYCKMMDVSTMTAFRDLNELVRKKLVKVEGQGRGTKYMLATR